MKLRLSLAVCYVMIPALVLSAMPMQAMMLLKIMQGSLILILQINLKYAGYNFHK